MIVIAIGDGLGNQMFQYAFFYSMKKHYKHSTILFDKEFYGSSNEHNGIELERIFNIKLPYCTRKQAMGLADYNGNLKKSHLFINALWGIRTIIWGRKETYLVEDWPTSFYKEFFELNPLKSYYLRGNWVNEKYFKEYRDQIINEFIFPEIEDEANSAIATNIKNTNSVSVHVRAGDYLNNGVFAKLTKEYYLEALDIIRKKCENEIKIFVFSDDKQYAENMFADFQNKVIVDCNSGENSYRDMQLMSICKHNVIANSTFSFWGAYLNQNEKKIVIAPKSAFSTGESSYACDEWIRL